MCALCILAYTDLDICTQLVGLMRSSSEHTVVTFLLMHCSLIILHSAYCILNKQNPAYASAVECKRAHTVSGLQHSRASLLLLDEAKPLSLNASRAPVQCTMYISKMVLPQRWFCKVSNDDAHQTLAARQHICLIGAPSLTRLMGWLVALCLTAVLCFVALLCLLCLPSLQTQYLLFTCSQLENMQM